jgi:hypothetical protein
MDSNRINKTCPNRSAAGLTLPEVGIVLAVLAGIAVVLLSSQPSQKAKERAKRVSCISQLKSIGLAFRMWSNDNGDKFPWQISAATNGTLEFAESPEVFRHFLAASNEVVSPKVLACPADTKVSRESDWAKFNNAHLSYFVGLDADITRPQTILFGDRNLTTNGNPAVGLVRVTSNTVLGFTRETHHTVGNVAVGDGSAHQVTPASIQKGLTAQIGSDTNQAIRLVIP